MTTLAHRAPISARSRLGRRPDRPYTEVDGHPVVIVPERRACYRIAPAALALWAALDGRPLGQVVDGLGPEADRHPLLDYVELVRRWRALGLVDECAAPDEAPPPPFEPAEPPATVALHATVTAEGAVLVVGQGADEPVAISVADSAVVGAERPLVGLVQVMGRTDPADADHPADPSPDPTPDPSPAQTLDALGVFEALVSVGDETDLEAEGTADALADLAETLRGLRIPGPDPDGHRLDGAVAQLAG